MKALATIMLILLRFPLCLAEDAAILKLRAMNALRIEGKGLSQAEVDARVARMKTWPN